MIVFDISKSFVPYVAQLEQDVILEVETLIKKYVGLLGRLF